MTTAACTSLPLKPFTEITRCIAAKNIAASPPSSDCVLTVFSLPSESRDTFWRSLHALNIARILIAALLLFFWGLGTPSVNPPSDTLSYRNICFVYLALAVVFALFTLYKRQRFLKQLLSQIVVDIGVVCLLYMAAGGMKSGMAILFLFPLASAAILVHMVLALFFASLVTLFLLIENWSRLILGQPDAPIMLAGLYGAAFFAAAFVLNRLAGKLISQENLAMARGLDLQIQQAINRLVIADMDDGVLVVDSDTTIFACNPAAEGKLGLSLREPVSSWPRLVDIPYLIPLAEAFNQWRAIQNPSLLAHHDSSAYLMLKPTEDIALPPPTTLDGKSALGLHLKVRFAAAASDDIAKDRSVIFLQDVAQIENQAQQLKLASMGRLTASIAHEVRNPLAAIAHASALLGEDAFTLSQQRLLKIVSDNVERMDRMIEDILNLSRKAQSQMIIDLAEMLGELKNSVDEMHALSESMIIVKVADSLRVRFDPIHFREVLLNLISNALRYASGQPGSIRIRAVQPTPSRLELHVQDDGPAISPEVRAHLFEPFYTTSSHGTGLGLYLARELCSNNGALLDYEFHVDDHSQELPTGRFVITFASPDLKMKEVSQ